MQPLRIVLHPDSPVPLYAQINEGIRLAIANGQLRPGDQLPPVRQLSVELKVNSNTVARVYADLERAGVLETRRGRGTFVLDRSERGSDAVRAWRLRSLARAFVTRCAEEGYSFSEVRDALAGMSGEAREKEEES
jgi:GntR family transcriptional regulator